MLERLGCGFVADAMDDLTAFYHIPAVEFAFRVVVDVRRPLPPCRPTLPAATKPNPATPCLATSCAWPATPRPAAGEPAPAAYACADRRWCSSLYALSVVVSQAYKQLEVAETVPPYHWVEYCLYFVAVSIMLDSYHQNLVSSQQPAASSQPTHPPTHPPNCPPTQATGPTRPGALKDELQFEGLSDADAGALKSCTRTVRS